MKVLFFIFCGLITFNLQTMNIPQTEISNSLIKAKIYLPDTEKGYYRGTRFDWSGNMPELIFNGHSYFGEWFTWYTKYNPETHDAIMGPVEEFTALDYTDKKPGETFVKIGVGVLTKPDNQPYQFARLYPVVNHGKWSVKKHSDNVEFTHILNDEVYSYRYDKLVQLVEDKPELVLIHTLKNTGKHTIETSVYDHNFFMIDNQPIGPDYVIKFPFKVTGDGEGIGKLAELKGNNIEFLRVVKAPETVFCGELQGFSPDSKDYEFRIENRKTKAGVRVSCDKPLLKLNYWNCVSTLCPEPYIKIKVEPGQQISWTIRYEFYTF